MNRFGIFVFYDASGIVDRYVEVLLQGLLPYLKKLVIVVNGDITPESEKRLKKCSDLVFHRENRGYDGGAYKDAILSFLVDEDWGAWDEVVLFNDTFYAPIFSWKDVFDRMENEPVDFWGLTRHPEGEKWQYIGPWYHKVIPEHLQSYFLVCRKNLLNNAAFQYFWQTLSEPKSYSDAVWNFEIRFTIFFTNQGFSSKAYTEVREHSTNVLQGTNLNPKDAFELLSKLKLPIVKRKVLSLANYVKAQNILQYIGDYTNYDVNLIYEHLDRLSKEDRISGYNPDALEKFCLSHKNVYIYGHGKVGKNIAAYFKDRGWKNAGFIVSADNDSASQRVENVFVYGDIEIGPDDGIVMGLVRGLWDVYPVIKREIPDEHLFLPKF